MTLAISDFSTTITTSEIGQKILDAVRSSVATGPVTLDFQGVNVMTTYCAKQVFGQLFNELGDAKFYQMIRFRNVSEDLQLVIQSGIESSIS